MNRLKKIVQMISIVFIAILTIQTTVEATESTSSIDPGKIVMGGQQYYCGNHGASLSTDAKYRLDYARNRNTIRWGGLCIWHLQ